MVALDIGAHVGFYGVFMAHLVGRSGRVYCFQPHRRNYRLLRRNLRANRFHWAEVYNLALSVKFADEVTS
jgi:FkbM family methyltransferase